ncbi:BatD family protein [Pseudidiomarina halophila]|uniref:BatD family protein n=1 Tax=Pseudidiomarina halophila TaxID=1449799 RepID=UPI0036171F88
MIPQRSGEQVIRGPLFQGQINVNSNRTLFPSFSSTESITTAAENLTLNVLPIPADWPEQSEWLPAEIVTLSVSVGSEGGDQEQGSAEQYSQGEPISLTYRLTAVGPLPDQFPRLDELVSALKIVGASVYPEAPESAVNQRNGRMVSQQTVRVAVIPHQAGELMIPALPVVWFNTQLRERDTATAPAQRFSIVASAGNQATLPEETQATGAAGQDASSTAITDTSAEQRDTLNEQQDSTLPFISQLKFWQILTVVFAALWLMTLLWALWRRQQVVAQPEQMPQDNEAPQQELRAIKHACMRDDASAVELLLKRWSRRHLGVATSQLTSIADYYGHAPLRSQLEHLQRCRFAAGDYNWHEGKALWRALQSALKSAEQNAKANQQSSDLPPLYPNSN